MKDDWENVKVFVKFLKTFCEITLKVSALLHVTSNTFFQQLCSILQQLNELSGSEDPLLSTMARNMKIFFDKSWGNADNINCLLFIAVVLDPRYKLDYVNYCLGMIYDPITTSKMSKKINESFASLVELLWWRYK